MRQNFRQTLFVSSAHPLAGRKWRRLPRRPPPRLRRLLPRPGTTARRLRAPPVPLRRQRRLRFLCSLLLPQMRFSALSHAPSRAWRQVLPFDRHRRRLPPRVRFRQLVHRLPDRRHPQHLHHQRTHPLCLHRLHPVLALPRRQLTRLLPGGPRPPRLYLSRSGPEVRPSRWAQQRACPWCPQRCRARHRRWRHPWRSPHRLCYRPHLSSRCAHRRPLPTPRRSRWFPLNHLSD
jgi:hypothetical protein